MNMGLALNTLRQKGNYLLDTSITQDQDLRHA